MRLQRLTGLERDKIETEYKEVVALIAELQGILANPQRVIEIIKAELLQLKEKYGDARRTKIVDSSVEFEVEDLIAEEDMVVTISHTGYIKRLPATTYRRQNRGGRGVAGFGGHDDDFVEHLFVASTHSYLMFFTDRGRCYWLKVHELPQAGRTARGKAIVNVLRLKDERVTSVIPVRDLQEGSAYLVFATRKGVIKRCELKAFSSPRPSGIIAIGLKDEDDLVAVALTRGESEIVLAKRAGKAVRFKETDVRATGRSAAGVRGATLEGGDDEVIGMVTVSRPDAEILVVTEKGFGKRTAIEDYRLTARGTKGVLTLKITEKNGPLMAIKQVIDTDELMIITGNGTLIRVPVAGISKLGRATQGVHVIRVEQDDRVVAVAHLAGAHIASGDASPSSEAADTDAPDDDAYGDDVEDDSNTEDTE
jgi:DNA gyrase subunit A